MNSTLKKTLGCIVAIAAILIGCDTVLIPLDDGTPGGTDPGDIVGADDVDLPAEETQSFFTAFQIDPVAEDTAGPKFVVAGDVDQDGYEDLVSAWNQSQPVQLHLQRRDPDGNISFRTITLGGTTPIAVVAGIELGQINDDGWLDVVVLVKADGYIGFCPPKTCTGSADCAGATLCIDGCCDGNCDPKEVSRLRGQIIIYFSPANANLIPNGDNWSETMLVNPLVVDELGEQWHNQFPGLEFVDYKDSQNNPEWNGFTALAVGNVDNLLGDDIVVAINPGRCDILGQEPPTNTVDLWVNPGSPNAENGTAWGAPVTLLADLPQVKDVELMDIDEDGDLDVIATYPHAISQNIRWARNPLPTIAVTTASAWQRRPIGQVDTGADVITLGDVDSDGSEDIMVRSTDGRIVQWFRRPNTLVVAPEFPPADPVPDRFNFPWQVFTLTELFTVEPGAIAIGDITGDGLSDAVVGAAGGVFWYDSTVGDSAYDPWFPNDIIQDDPDDTPGTADQDAAPGSGVGVEATDTTTLINDLLVVDLDGDGRLDIVGTLDRQTGSGLSDDRLVWYRNIRTD